MLLKGCGVPPLPAPPSCGPESGCDGVCSPLDSEKEGHTGGKSEQRGGRGLGPRRLCSLHSAHELTTSGLSYKGKIKVFLTTILGSLLHAAKTLMCI